MDTHYNPNEGARRSIARALAAYFAEASSLVEPDEPRISIARAITQAGTPDGLTSGPERELMATTALACGHAFDPHRLHIPLSAFRRDLTVASAPSAGLLAPTDTAEAWQPLRGHSVVIDAGATIITTPGQALATPVVQVDPATSWQAVENGPFTEGTITFGNVLTTPKLVGAYVEISRQLLLQGAAVEPTIQRCLLRAVGRALDLAVLTGSGAAGQPLGLAGTGGIATASGTSITWATLAQLRATVEQGAGSDRGLQWLGGYTAHRVLAAREKVATSGNMIWADRRIDGDPAAVTKGSPADSLFMGDWTQLAVVLFGAAIRVEVDPFSQFRTGVVGMRCVLACDTAVMMPSAFGAVSSIT